MTHTLRIAAVCGMLALASCGGGGGEAENLDAKADRMEQAADRSTDDAQAEVLENQAGALRDAADGGEQVDAEGSVTVIKE